ncbi:MAG: hypothetical protein A3F67_07055 [Verrucomicrobia bacterium RIFCSPHIGHO2_12_FULL_41_10]|nr:MAG: hypothetical protein A3F67_07055 [Verrucomicrobia bacterium RIFCSPHIGHO2_12_FULL_41_10]
MGDSSKEARGHRLRQLRALTAPKGGRPLTRAALARKYFINAHTLKNWEVGHASGLTESGAKQMINVYQKEYIDCSIHWLMTGEGPEPKRQRTTPTEGPHPQERIDPLATLEDEINAFKSLQAEGVIFVVKDDAMAPIYLQGDTVAGIRYYAKDLARLIDKDCVVETGDGNTWLRRIQNSTVPGRYNLYAINPSTKIELPAIYSVEILSAAPVIRIWRGKKWQP